MSHYPSFRRWRLDSGAIVQEIDWIDPLSAFTVFAERDFSLWLDSSDSSHPVGRYSYIAVDPYDWMILHDDKSCGQAADAFTLLKSKLSHWSEKWYGVDEALPLFRGGAAGFFSYDLAYVLEKLPLPSKPYTLDEVALPDMAVGFYDMVLSFDHRQRQCFIFSTGFPERGSEKRLKRARRRLDGLSQKLSSLPNPSPPPFLSPEEEPQSDCGAGDYQRKVEKIINYIHEGEILQVNLSHPFTGRLHTESNAFDFYQCLRQISPVPFAGFFQCDDFALACASPERFLFHHQGIVETRPIKGTLPRGKTASEDERQKQKLLSSPKDRRENIMIVDLLRNDLSKVCEPNSISVPDLCRVESFSVIHHLVSVVRGRSRATAHALDCLRACFPGGSVTGAPKIRAMEIIAEMENYLRGPYCGAMGYIGFDGTMDTNIMIRTAIITRERMIRFQTGGGIVAQSDPEAEYFETLDKAQSMMKTLGLSYTKQMG